MGLSRVGYSLLMVLGLLPMLPVAFAQQGMTPPGIDADAAISRYRDQILSSAYYDPSDQVPQLRFGPAPQQGFALPPKLDAHIGIKGYMTHGCASCHETATANSHKIKSNITCHQCHGGRPIASSDHYFSPMNPIRRHAYVCAKCHEGASASFATYVVHQDHEITSDTRKTFPALYWSHAFMLALIVGVMLIFLLHGIAWWIREWFVKHRDSEG